MTMDEQKSVLDFALSEFQFVVNKYGFDKPIIEEKGGITTIDYLKKNIGIEIELDWRDMSASLMVVRLENGCLPDGYYVSNGKTCRKHLRRVFCDHGWAWDGGKNKSLSPRSMARMKDDISADRRNLIARIKDVVYGERIFVD